MRERTLAECVVIQSSVVMHYGCKGAGHCGLLWLLPTDAVKRIEIFPRKKTAASLAAQQLGNLADKCSVCILPSPQPNPPSHSSFITLLVLVLANDERSFPINNFSHFVGTHRRPFTSIHENTNFTCYILPREAHVVPGTITKVGGVILGSVNQSNGSKLSSDT